VVALRAGKKIILRLRQHRVTNVLQANDYFAATTAKAVESKEVAISAPIGLLETINWRVEARLTRRPGGLHVRTKMTLTVGPFNPRHRAPKRPPLKTEGGSSAADASASSDRPGPYPNVFRYHAVWQARLSPRTFAEPTTARA